MTLLLLLVATLVSEDLACISAGLLVAQGTIEFVPGMLACVAGILIGDIFLYLACRSGGRTVVRWFVNEDDLAVRAAWFQRRGPVVLWITRFVPGTRLPTYFAAGLLRMGFWRFTLWLLAAGLVWVPLLVGLAMVVGANARRWFGYYQYTALTVVALWLVVKLAVPLFTWRGRRLMLSRWRRLTRWEFWPWWVVYPPVVLYILWLGVKHRSFTLFTAANPGIPAGGLIGESKSAILDKLPSEFVARQVQSEFPLVVKPDAGQRGLGVAILRTPEEWDRYFAKPRGKTIVQEYVPGQEFGVFYYRLPNEERGQIFSITEKRPVGVVGDGASTLEELILRDERAVCLARYFLKRHAAQLARVLPAGEPFTLAELGTHCRGALFLDGAHMKTPELEAVMDLISRQFEGFFIGRYDIRTPSVEDFKRGQNFKIIELNGVTSEATHIYNPGYSLWNGWRTLAEQWRLTFEIAAQNRARGQASLTPGEVWRLVRQYQPAREA